MTLKKFDITQEGLDKIKAIFKEKLDKFDSVTKDWNTSGN